MQQSEVYDARTEARARFDTIPDLSGLPEGAISMGVGITDEPGNYTLAVRIREKFGAVDIESQLRETLSSMIALRHNLTFDIRYTGPVFALQPRLARRLPPLAGRLSIGDSISHEKAYGGTLGFFATDNANGDAVGIVSANHVIAEADEAHNGDSIVSPESSSAGSVQVAKLVRSVSLHGGGLKLVDAAFANLTTKNYDTQTLANGTLLHGTAGVQQNTMVQKVGQGSQLTFGRVRSFGYDKLVVHGYSASLHAVTFADQIEIESSDPLKNFAFDGDSGSLVTNNQFHAVGLLFSRCVAGGKSGLGLAYASPIDTVLRLLNVSPLP